MRPSTSTYPIIIYFLVNSSLLLVNSSFVGNRHRHYATFSPQATENTDTSNIPEIRSRFDATKRCQSTKRHSSVRDETLDNDTQMRFAGVGR